jgi:hypothetical protein
MLYAEWYSRSRPAWHSVIVRMTMHYSVQAGKRIGPTLIGVGRTTHDVAARQCILAGHRDAASEEDESHSSVSSRALLVSGIVSTFISVAWWGIDLRVDRQGGLSYSATTPKAWESVVRSVHAQSERGVPWHA